jgi:hypothetical protein
MGGKNSVAGNYIKSWTTNPLENLATRGASALYHGVAGSDAKGSSSFMPEVKLFNKPKEIGVNVPKNIGEAETQMIQRQAAIASGKAPSYSELMYKQGLEDLQKQQMSSAASARGVSNPGLLQRNAMQLGQQAGLDVIREGAASKIQEQRAADQLIAQQAAAARGVSVQANIANQQNAMAQRGQNLGFLGGLGSAGAMLAASDENMKEDIKPSGDSGNKMVESFMDALKSYTYEYKNKKNNGKENPDGKVTSVMAQDLEKSELGKQMVKESPEGKMVDYAQGMAPLFAAIAELNSRTKKLEGK